MSKARASMGSRTTIDSLYIFTNESLLHKEKIKPVTLTSFESFVASCNIPAAEADDVLTSLSTLGIGVTFQQKIFAVTPRAAMTALVTARLTHLAMTTAQTKTTRKRTAAITFTSKMPRCPRASTRS